MDATQKANGLQAKLTAALSALIDVEHDAQVVADHFATPYIPIGGEIDDVPGYPGLTALLLNGKVMAVYVGKLDISTAVNGAVIEAAQSLIQPQAAKL